MTTYVRVPTTPITASDMRELCRAMTSAELRDAAHRLLAAADQMALAEAQASMEQLPGVPA